MRCLLLAVALNAAWGHSTPEGALLFFSKRVLDEGPAVQHKNLTIQYTLHNGGQADAVDVQVSDSFGETFDVVDGHLERSFDVIRGGDTLAYTLTVVPKAVGELATFGAVVSYSFRAGGTMHRTGMSTSLGNLSIMSQKAFLRATKLFWREWCCFTCHLLVSIVGPLLLYKSRLLKT